MSNAGASGAPIGDMMVLVGTWAFGSYSAGKAFMLIEAFTVFLALIGTTLSCMNTGARVTYAMGRDEEVPTQFGLLHGRTLSPHRAVWFLAFISIIVGILTTVVYLGGQSSDMAALDKHNFWYSFGIFSPHAYVTLPNTRAHHHADQQLWHVPALYDHLHRGHRGLPRAPQFPRVQACGRSGVRTAGQLRLHVVLLDWPVLVFAGMSVKEPYIALGVSAAVDHYRSHLPRHDQQVQRQGDYSDRQA